MKPAFLSHGRTPRHAETGRSTSGSTTNGTDTAVQAGNGRSRFFLSTSLLERSGSCVTCPSAPAMRCVMWPVVPAALFLAAARVPQAPDLVVSCDWRISWHDTQRFNLNLNSWPSVACRVRISGFADDKMRSNRQIRTSAERRHSKKPLNARHLITIRRENPHVRNTVLGFNPARYVLPLPLKSIENGAG